MNLSGQLHPEAVLPPEKKTPLTTEEEDTLEKRKILPLLGFGPWIIHPVA
jgi:hypothetical protein